MLKARFGFVKPKTQDMPPKAAFTYHMLVD
jgi:hypothetical protein